MSRARLSELLRAQWEEIDLERGIWTLPLNRTGKLREVVLTRAAMRVIEHLPRWDGVPYLLANPNTKQPYQSILKSWDVTRQKAGLPCVEIDDLRFADICGPARQTELAELALDPTAGGCATQRDDASSSADHIETGANKS